MLRSGQGSPAVVLLSVADLVRALIRGPQIAPGRNLPQFPDLRHNKAMDTLFHFALALIAAGFPWLAGVLVIAIALRIAGPVHLSIGGRRSRKRER